MVRICSNFPLGKNKTIILFIYLFIFEIFVKYDLILFLNFSHFFSFQNIFFKSVQGISRMPAKRGWWMKHVCTKQIVGDQMLPQGIDFLWKNSLVEI